MKLIDLIRLRRLQDAYFESNIRFCNNLKRGLSQATAEYKTAVCLSIVCRSRYEDCLEELKDKHGISDYQKLMHHLRSFRGYRLIRWVFNTLGLGHYV